jgi:SsrA-binding protein
METTPIKTIAKNKRARHEYFVDEVYEAGIELLGTEVKSVRQGKVSLVDAYVDVRQGEAYVLGMHIAPYEQGNIFNKDPLRPRRLLLHKREIMKLLGQLKEKGYTLIPLSVYLKGSYVKVELGLCRGKKLYDKRADAAQRDAKRSMERALKERNVGAM